MTAWPNWGLCDTISYYFLAHFVSSQSGCTSWTHNTDEEEEEEKKDSYHFLSLLVHFFKKSF